MRTDASAWHMERSNRNIAVEVHDLWRSYCRGSETINACAGIDLSVEQGEIVAIVGRSGSGKTTLLNLIGGLDSATRGRILVGGEDITRKKESALVRFRRTKVGFIFQLFYLIPTLNVRENVELPLIFSRRRNRQKVRDVLERIGIADQEGLFPSQLDGGSMQKVAIARALVNDPEILLADEPTGRLELDVKNAVLDIFRKLAADGLTIIIATHDLDLAKKTGRIIRLSDGVVQKE
jgi:putative ABC transport system ATP-binding protein